MQNRKDNSGFTLIELLIVIAILALLAVIVMVLINPAEKLALGRDTGRISGVTQLGKIVTTYYLDNNSFPDPATWDTQLISADLISAVPAGTPYSINSVTNCINNVKPTVNPTFCYDYDDTNPDNGAIVYARLETANNLSKCSTGVPYFVYSTADGRPGTICSETEPTPWPKNTQTYLQ